MILQILADSGQMLHNRNSQIAKVLAISDAGALQDHRRCDRPRAKNHFLACSNGHFTAVAREAYTGRTAAVEQHLVRQDIGDDAQIRPLPRRLEEGARRG